MCGLCCVYCNVKDYNNNLTKALPGCVSLKAMVELLFKNKKK